MFIQNKSFSRAILIFLFFTVSLVSEYNAAQGRFTFASSKGLRIKENRQQVRQRFYFS